MANDTIFIEGMRAAAHVGVTAAERETSQVLHFDLELRCDLRRAGASDDLADTIDYAAVYEQVVTVAADTRCALLEHLAARIAHALLSAFPACAQVRVRVGKPALFPATGRSGMPGVEITRSRAERGTGGP